MLNTGCDEFDEGECDKDGYNRYGYDREGYDRDGCNKEGYGRDGYNRSGYNLEGYVRDGYYSSGFNIEGYDRDGYNFFGHDKDGYDFFGYDKYGRNRFGYDRSGYNRYGYNKEGYNRYGYNRYGYNKEGYDKDGYNRSGYDKHRRHRSNKDEQKKGGGYKPNGKNRHKKEDDRYNGDYRKSEVERRDEQYKADCEAACKVKRLSKLTPRLPKVLKNCTLATRTVDNVEKLLGDIKKHQLDATGLWRGSSEQFNKGAKKILSEHLEILGRTISVIEKSVTSSSANGEGKSQAEISESISGLREILAGRGLHFRKVIRNVDQGKYEGHDTEIKKTIRIVLTSIPKYKTIVEALYGALCEEVCKVQLLSKLESLFPKVLKKCKLNPRTVDSVKKLIADTKKHQSDAMNLRVVVEGTHGLDHPFGGGIGCEVLPGGIDADFLTGALLHAYVGLTSGVIPH